MLFPFQTLFIVAHSLAFAFTQSTLPSSNISASALPLSFGGFTTTTNDTNNPLSNTGFVCASGGAGSPARPKISECTNALFIMLQDAVIRNFNRGGDQRDLSQLPRSYQSGRCKITVRLEIGVMTEVTTWDRIGLDATRLVFACDGSTEEDSTRRTGGQVKTGFMRGIVISVYSVLRPPAEVEEDIRTMMNGSSIM